MRRSHFFGVLAGTLAVLLLFILRRKNEADDDLLKYKFCVIPIIFTVGLIGLCIPIITIGVLKLTPNIQLFSMIKALLAGVVLSNGFAFVLPDAYTILKLLLWNSIYTNYEIQSVDLMINGYYAMVSSMVLLMVSTVGFGSTENSIFADLLSIFFEHSTAHLIKNLLHNSIMHSVCIGISIGASIDLITIKPMLAALAFHQYYEGMRAGEMSFDNSPINETREMIAHNLLAAPVGIGIGIVISSVFKEKTASVIWIFYRVAADMVAIKTLLNLLPFFNRILNQLRLRFGDGAIISEAMERLASYLTTTR